MRFKIIPAVVILLAGCSAPEVPVDVTNGLDSIASGRVPDTREAVCRYDVSMVNSSSVLIKGETSMLEVKQEMLGFLEDAGYAVIDSFRVLPDADIARKWGLVTISVSNLMNKPSFTGEQVTQSLMGTPVRILEKSGGWILIQTPDHYLGWVTGSAIIEQDDASMKAWKGSTRIIFLSRDGEIVEGSDEGSVISDITAGAILEMTGLENRYFLVKTPDGREGRIGRNHAAELDKWISSVRPDPEQMIRFARSMKGFPYMWGGTSTKAVDCSGFVKTIYYMSGLILARDASQQWLYGSPVDVSVSIDQLLPGDLVFFGHLNDEGSRRITHVGMYIGDSEVIHSSGMVRINSLDPGRANYSEYLGKTMMGARRLIGEKSQKGILRISDHTWYFN